MANYPVPYQNSWNYGGVGQQMYPQYGQQGLSQTVQPQTRAAMEWVDGEVGAKAFQKPEWLPNNQPVALWDTNDTVIYLKSWNPMGMPNPLQKAHYTLEGLKSGEKTHGFSGDSMADYVRKDEMERMKQELMEAINGIHTGASGTQQAGNERRVMK